MEGVGDDGRLAPGGARSEKEEAPAEEGTTSQRSVLQGKPVIFEIEKAIVGELRGRPDVDNKHSNATTLNLEQILESMPFCKLLENIAKTTDGDSIPLVTRTYEESFMRQSNSLEEDCVMKEECECMKIDERRRFVGTRFILPNITTTNNCTLCVLCLRKITQLIYYKIINEGVRVQMGIQKYGNICGEAGEYHPSAMLMCPSNLDKVVMPLPIVAHQRNRYSVEEVTGQFVIRQHRVHMEDF